MPRLLPHVLRGTLATAISSSCAAQSESEPVTYADTISPIISKNCIACHHQDGIGPFPLETYEQVRRRARQIVEVTQNRFMPPWKPDPGYGPALIGERILSNEDMQALKKWYESGVQPGDPTRVPQAGPTGNQWLLGEPDLVIELEEDYILPGEGKDVYRNFVVPIPLQKTAYVTSFELLPKSRLAIHHALLMLDSTGRSRERDKAEDGIGFDGMGIGSSAPPSGHIVGWTPGQVPYEAHSDTAWELAPGTDLVLQFHMLPNGKPTRVNPKIGLHFADKPPLKKSFVFQLREYDIDIPAGESAYTVSKSLQIPVSLFISSVYPHAHYLGKDIKFFATLPDGEIQQLLRISDWDFNWQGDYRYQEPVFLPAGSKLHMEYVFDNSETNIRNPNSPPVNVRGGWRSTDEMAELMVQVIPENQKDIAELEKAQREFDVTLAGGEALYHYAHGGHLEQQGEFHRAKRHYELAIESDPSLGSAYHKLATIYERQGQTAQAMATYRAAFLHQPNLVSPRIALARLLFRDRRLEEGEVVLKEALSANPDSLETCLYLVGYYGSSGNTDAAMQLFEQSEPHFAQSPRFYTEYGIALEIVDDLTRAEEAHQKALALIDSQSDSRSNQEHEAFRANAVVHLARLYERQSKFGEAINVIESSLHRLPNHAASLLTSARLAIETGDTSKAANQLFSLVSLPLENALLHEDIVLELPLPYGAIFLADAYVKSGDRDTAVKSLLYAAEFLAQRGLLFDSSLLEEKSKEILASEKQLDSSEKANPD